MVNTGMIMKRPSMRSAKIAASDTVARNSGALMRVEVADGLDIGSVIWMSWAAQCGRPATGDRRRAAGGGRPAARNRLQQACPLRRPYLALHTGGAHSAWRGCRAVGLAALRWR